MTGRIRKQDQPLKRGDTGFLQVYRIYILQGWCKFLLLYAKIGIRI